MGQFAAAQHHCRRAIELDSRQPTAYLNLGTLEASENRWPEARQHLARAVELSPRDVRARTNYAIALVMTGDTPAAFSQLQIALRIDPAFAPARQTLHQLQSAADSNPGEPAAPRPGE